MASTFTLVSTVYNEAARLNQTIEELKKQTIQPSEIIITDAGSVDGTYEILLAWQKESAIPIKILQKNKCNVAEGRNMAIRAASYPLIASTDFGCRFHPQWLESIMLPFADPAVKAVAGAFTVKDEDIESLPAKAAYLLFNGYKDDIQEEWFTPTSRSVAYYKEVFDRVGGYCEWLTLAADDTIFGRLVKKAGFKFFPVEKPFVFWGRHKTATGYNKEAFRYGLGDGESGINMRSTLGKCIDLTLRFSFVVGLISISFFVLFNHLSAYFFLCMIPFVVGFRPYIYHIKNWLRIKTAKYNLNVLLYSFYLLESTRYNYLKGYYKGYFKSPSFRKNAAIELKKRLVE
ncbi:MAG TPA: glycosyltransferase [Cytophaga sp.]|jgi:glycosyltransferase involved in cell wall biosynthesis|nr:glycosyltransferase [Cytophaga sp.]